MYTLTLSLTHTNIGHKLEVNVRLVDTQQQLKRYTDIIMYYHVLFYVILFYVVLYCMD